MTDEELLSVICSVPIQFGLQSQGHIAKIESMLSNGKTWEDIGNAIGWCPKTVKQHWDWHIEKGG